MIRRCVRTFTLGVKRSGVGLLLIEAAAAVNRSSLRRIERNGRLFPALCTLGIDLDLVWLTGRLCHFDRGEATVLRAFAFLASLGRIQEVLFVKERLLASGPHE
jgi:hypothetical protein